MAIILLLLPLYVFIELLGYIKGRCTKHCCRKYKRAKIEPIEMCESTHLPIDGIATELRIQQAVVAKS